MKKVRLGDIATVITKGTTPTTLGYNFVDDGVNFVKIESITENGEFLTDKFAHISDECNRKLSRSQLQRNDLLFSIAGAIGRTAIVTEDILPANTNQALAIIRVPEGVVDYSYLKYVLQSPDIVEQFEKKKQGVAQLNISLKDIGDFVIPLRTTEEQKTVVDTLDKVTELVALRKEQLAKLDQLVKSRFAELFGECEEHKRLEEYASLITKGASPKWQGVDYCEKGTLFITSENVREGFLDLSKRKYLDDKINEIQPRSILKRNDILINIVGASIGRAAVYDCDEVANINQAVALVRVDYSQINQTYLMTFLNSPQAIEMYGKMKKGGARDNLSLQNITDLQIPVAHIEQQEQIAAFVKQTDKSKLAIQQSLDKLELLKKFLMQEYFG